MTDIRDLVISKLKKEIKHKLETQNTECPNCGSIEVEVEVWESCGVLSAAIACNNCRSENYLEIENNGMRKIESGLEEINDILESPDFIC